MALEDLEVSFGDTKLRGVILAIVISFGSTVGGGIYGFAQFMSRIDGIEANLAETADSIPNIEPLQIQIEAISTRIEDNDLAHLQGKLAELDTLLKSIKERQVEVLDDARVSRKKVEELEKQWLSVLQEYKTMSDSLNTMSDSLNRYQKKLDKFKTEVDNLWQGLDALASPLQ